VRASAIREDRDVRRPVRSRVRRLGGALIPWAVAIFLLLVAGEEEPAGPGFDAARSAAMVLAVVQGAALHWRRTRPELVMAVVLAAGFGFQLIVPEVVIPIAGLFAIGSLAAARPPRVSRDRWRVAPPDHHELPSGGARQAALPCREDTRVRGGGRSALGNGLRRGHGRGYGRGLGAGPSVAGGRRAG
jgi:hypothetical protein